MARLLYSATGIGPRPTDSFAADASNSAAFASYETVLSRYRRARTEAEKQRATRICQRHARQMLDNTRARHARKEQMIKHAALRMLIRLQARFRSRRLRREQRAQQEALAAKLTQRRAAVLIQRRWRDELERRVLQTNAVRSILARSTDFLTSWRELCSSELASGMVDVGARAQQRWNTIKGLNITVALTVCSMFRQRVRAADCIRGANKRMLAERHRAYFLAVFSIQRILRRGIKAYNARKSDREAARKYEWIDRTEAVLVLQRVWRALRAARDGAAAYGASAELAGRDLRDGARAAATAAHHDAARAHPGT